MNKREINSVHLTILSESIEKGLTLCQLGVCNTKSLLSRNLLSKRGKKAFGKTCTSNIIHKFLLFSSNYSGKMFKVRVIAYEGMLLPLTSIIDSGLRMSLFNILSHLKDSGNSLNANKNLFNFKT